MKKIILLFLIVICMIFSCTVIPEPELIPGVDPEIIPDVTPDDARIIGIWNRDTVSWEFTIDGDFTYYRNDTNEILNEGWYFADTENNTIYVEDSVQGESQLYLYEVLYDVPEFGSVTLRWSPDANPSGFIDWVKE